MCIGFAGFVVGIGFAEIHSIIAQSERNECFLGKSGVVLPYSASYHLKREPEGTSDIISSLPLKTSIQADGDCRERYLTFRKLNRFLYTVISCLLALS